MSFIAYPHLERFGKEDVEGIIAGDCYIFPKIDGSNGSIWVEKVEPDEGQQFPILEFCTGSRNRELSIEDDNAGFMAWAASQDNLRKFFKNYPHLRLYGEWLVPHTFKGYRKDAWRKFYVFDVAEVEQESDGENWLKFLPYDEYKPLLEEFGVEYIPAVKIIKNPSDEELEHELNNNLYLVEAADTPGEGIVIKNYAFKNKWGRTIWAKMVRSEFKYANIKEFGTSEGGTKKVEEEIINRYITEAFCLKEYDKIMHQATDQGPKSIIPRTLETIFHTFIVEESWNFIKEHNMPQINFKLLRALCINATKAHLPQLFI